MSCYIPGVSNSKEQSRFLSPCSCVFIILDFGVTFHVILFAKCTPNTFTGVREDLAHLENGLGYQQAVPWYWGKKRNRNIFFFFLSESNILVLLFGF